jgi:heptosyltransferase III
VNPQNILLIRPDRLGDLILSLPVAQVLRDRFPACRITYLAAPDPSEIAPMVECVDNWIKDESSSGRISLFKLVRILRQGNFDLLIELKPSWRTATAGYLSQIPVRIGTGRRFYSFFYNNRLNVQRRGSGKHQSDLDLALLKPLGINISGVIPKLVLPGEFKIAAGKLVGESIKEYIVIHPGSGGSAPNWPVQYFGELAKMILRESNLGVIIAGIESNLGDFEGCLDLRGKTKLSELAGIVAGADMFISGSTGPLHLADALGTKSLTFFTRHVNVDANRWGPRRHPDGVMIPEGERCKFSDPVHCSCLEQITPREAFNKIRLILNINASGKAITP